VTVCYVGKLTGICGGSASGKTTVATKIIESLDVPWVTLLSMDSFYKVTSVAYDAAVMLCVLVMH
jgi:uridine kinase